MSPKGRLDALWLPVNAVQFLLTLGWGAFWITIALLVTLVGRRRAPALWLARRVWAPGQLAIGLIRLEVVGLEKIDLERPSFFVANHQSWIDIPALFAALPVPLHFLAKQELARVPFLGWYMRAMGMVFVDRGARRSAAKSVERAAELLASNGSLVSFPEGTRGAPGTLGRFKSAGFAAALEPPARAAVVPIAIEGAGRILPRGGFRVRPGPLAVRIGEPIVLAGLSLEDRAELARRAERAVAELLGLAASSREGGGAKQGAADERSSV